MAEMNINFPDDLIKTLNELGQIENHAPKIIDAAIPILERSVRSAVASNKGDYTTGALARSIKATKARINKYGCYAAVRPTGTDEKGISNMQKLVEKELGNSRQQARPVVDAATNAVEGEVLEIMQEEFNKLVEP